GCFLFLGLVFGASPAGHEGQHHGADEQQTAHRSSLLSGLPGRSGGASSKPRAANLAPAGAQSFAGFFSSFFFSSFFFSSPGFLTRRNTWSFTQAAVRLLL